MAAFAKRLEFQRQDKLARHARKMRPNYDGNWIFKLKSELKRLDTQRGETSKAAAGAGQSGKH